MDIRIVLEEHIHVPNEPVTDSAALLVIFLVVFVQMLLSVPEFIGFVICHMLCSIPVLTKFFWLKFIINIDVEGSGSLNMQSVKEYLLHIIK